MESEQGGKEVDDYLTGWVDLRQIKIPAMKSAGFAENILIREYIPPKVMKRVPETEKVSNVERAVFAKPESLEEPTVLIPEAEKYMGEEPTVLITQDEKFCAFIKRKKTGEIAEITQDEFVVGKSSEADFVISGNPTVSRKHIKIHKRENEYWLEDLNSANHVYIDGKQITKPYRLIDGMEFRLSNDEEFEFMIRIGQ